MNDIRLADFRAESLQFDMNHHFQPKEDENLQLSIKLDQRVRMSSTPKEPVFLNIRVTLFDNAEVNNYPFEIIADVTGVFFIEAEGTDREAVLRDNGMTMLLPYVPPLDPSQLQPIDPTQAQ